MSWVEDALVNAFLSTDHKDDECDEGPEVARLGWSYDRSSAFYYHRSLGERFANAGGVFFDHVDRQFYYYDEQSLSHKPMDMSKISLLREAAANAKISLPRQTGEESPIDLVEDSSEEDNGDKGPTPLEDTWKRPWDEWVEGEGAGADLALAFFADRALQVVFALAMETGQLFRYTSSDGIAGYESCGAPFLRIHPKQAPDVDGEAEGNSVPSIEKELFAYDTLLGSGSGAKLRFGVGNGVSHQHCLIRYHPGRCCWQVNDLGSETGTIVNGKILNPARWTCLTLNGRIARGGGASETRQLDGIGIGRLRFDLSAGHNVSQPRESPAGPCSWDADFLVNPDLLPPPPVDREVVLELDNALRRKRANCLSISERVVQIENEEKYQDRASHRRATRTEWQHGALAPERQSQRIPSPSPRKRRRMNL